MENKKYFLYALLSALLFGASTPASKYLLQFGSPILLASLYYFGAALILLPVSFRTFKSEWQHVRKDPHDLKRLLGGVVFGGILGPVFLLYGIRLMDATSASLLLNFETVATAIIGFLIFKEHIGPKIILSSIITVIAGSLLVVTKDFSINWGGILIGLACLSWGFDNNYTASVEGVSPSTNTIIKGVVAGSFNLVAAFLLSEANLPLGPVLLALLIGGLSYGVSIALYITSARHLGATRSQIIFAFNPFIGSLLSFLIFWNALNIQFWWALALMICAILILYYERHSHKHLHPTLSHTHEHSHDDGHHFHSHAGLDSNIKHTHAHDHEELEHEHAHFPNIHHKHRHP